MTVISFSGFTTVYNFKYIVCSLCDFTKIYICISCFSVLRIKELEDLVMALEISKLQMSSDANTQTMVSYALYLSRMSCKVTLALLEMDFHRCSFFLRGC